MNYPLTVFYDKNCPLCRSEMHALRELALAQNPQAPAIQLVDVNGQGFDPSPYGATLEQMNALVHAQKPDGSIVLGLEVIKLCYEAVGSGQWLALSRWPVIKPLSNWAYFYFAKHRQFLSRWLAPLFEVMVARRILKKAQKSLAATQACHQNRCSVNTK